MNAKQTAFLQAMLTESTISKAVKVAKIGHKTAYGYMKNPEFKKELSLRRGQCVEDTVRYLQGKLSLCNETLVGIIENPNTGDQVKINAITAVFSNWKSLTETEEIMRRLQAIEETIEQERN